MQHGGMSVIPGAYVGITLLNMYTTQLASCLLSLTFSIQYRPGSPVKHRTPAQHLCYPLSWCGCISSKLDFRGLGNAIDQEGVGFMGSSGEKPALVNVLSWGS